MARPKSNNINVMINIDKDKWDEINLILFDPTKGKLRYGAVTAVFNTLIDQWLEAMKKPGIDPVAFLKAYGVKINEVELATEANGEDNEPV